MARYFKILFLFCCIGLASCQEGGEAGDLFGQWRMKDSDTNYISFSGSVTWLKSIHNHETGVFGNFQHVGDSLFIQCYSPEGMPEDTAIVEHTFGFKPFKNIRVKIDVLDSDCLILSKDNKTWSFNKY
jgi:hypothetical protein